MLAVWITLIRITMAVLSEVLKLCKTKPRLRRIFNWLARTPARSLIAGCLKGPWFNVSASGFVCHLTFIAMGGWVATSNCSTLQDMRICLLCLHPNGRYMSFAPRGASLRDVNWVAYCIAYLSDITPHKYHFLPCGMSAVTLNIYMDFNPVGLTRDWFK